MGVGENIKRIRKEKKLTQKQLGERLGVSQAAIGQFENGKSSPRLETIKKIALALDVSEDKLLDRVYDDDLATAMLEILERDLFGKPYLSENDRNYYIEKIKDKLIEASNIEDDLERDDFSNAEAINICTELISHLCKVDCTKNLSTDILDLVDLVGYFLTFSYEAKRTVLDLEKNLFEIVHPKPEPDWIKSIRAKHSPKKD